MNKNNPDKNNQSRFLIQPRWLIFAGVILIAMAITALGVTGQVDRNLHRPLPYEWVEIPAGEFMMGSSEEDSDAHLDEFPQHLVSLDAYRIGRYPVTNQQYAECVRAGICKKPSLLLDNPEKVDHPVVNITWETAQAFCQWNGGRLPTEAEWERAARGELVGALYPWGDEIDCNLANYGDCVGDTSPVGSYPPNGFGLHDMAGNVWEWVADWYSGSYYRNSPDENPPGPADGEHRVLRGGTWGEEQSSLRVAHRRYNLPSYPHDFIGFRCASSIPWPQKWISRIRQ